MKIFVLAIAAFFVFLFLSNLIGPLFRLRRLRHIRQIPLPVDASTVPQTTKDALGTYRECLLQHGFISLGYSHEASTLDGHTCLGTYSELYLSPDRTTLAVVSESQAPIADVVAHLKLISKTDHDKWLISVVGFHFTPTLSSPTRNALNQQAPTLDVHLQRHHKRCEGLTLQLWDSDIRFIDENLFDDAINNGTMYKRQSGENTIYALTWKGAWQFVIRFRANAAQNAGSGIEGIGLKDESSLQEIHRSWLQNVLKTVDAMANISGKERLLRFAVSFALTLLILTFILGTVSALMLTGVLLLHEAGHMLAMYLSGYKNLQMTFVPGLGAYTTGKPDRLHPWRQFWIYVAGPLPGLLIGLGLAVLMLNQHLASNALLWSFVTYACVVNYVNLLPILPMDGARIVEYIWVTRRPGLNFAFWATSAALFVLLALALDDPASMVFAFLLMLSLPNRWRLYRLQKDIVVTDRNAAEQQLASHLSQTKHRVLPFFHRVRLLMMLLNEYRLEAGFTVTQKSLAIAIYIGLLLSPIFAWQALAPAPKLKVERVYQRLQTHVFNHHQPQSLEEQLRHAKNADEKWQILMSAVEDLDYGDDELANGYLAQAATLSQSFPADDLRRLTTLEAQIDSNYGEVARAYIDEALAWTEGRYQSNKDLTLRRARLLLKRYHSNEKDSWQQRQQLLVEAESSQAANLDDHDLDLALTRKALAKHCFKNPECMDTEKWLQMIERTADTEMLNVYAGYLLQTGRYREAQQKLDLSYKGINAHEGEFLRDQIDGLYVYALTYTGKIDEAITLLQSVKARNVDAEYGVDYQILEADLYDIAGAHAKRDQIIERYVQEQQKAISNRSCDNLLSSRVFNDWEFYVYSREKQFEYKWHLCNPIPAQKCEQGSTANDPV